MPRTARAAIGGIVYHVLNRGNGRAEIFREPDDYQAFIALLATAKARARIEIFGFCLMPNHWHLVVRPRGDRDLATFMSWVSNTHVKRYRARHPRTSGHLYQGRYKSFAVEEDEYLLTLLRYIESNPLRAKLVRVAENWRWSSLGCDDRSRANLLDPWPVDRPRNWTALVNESLPAGDLDRMKVSLERGRPLGGVEWTIRMAQRLGVQYTLNPRGRPQNKEGKS